MRSILAAVLLGLFVVPAGAHSTILSTSPQSGSVLDQSPPTIEFTFRDPVRLTSVVVVQNGKPDRKLEFEPSDSAATFKLHRPQLGPGHNKIQWKALSKDGHVISGSVILVIAPAASKTN
jgi:methionine-rich copper-binding protein CopC